MPCASELQKSVQKGAEHVSAGRRAQAEKVYADALSSVHADSKSSNAILVGALTLGYANIILDKGGWPTLNGKDLDKLLADSIEAARAGKQRSRALESQLVFTRSRALLAKPGIGSAELDAGVKLRFEAIELQQEGAVEEIPWTLESVRSRFDKELKKEQEFKYLSHEELAAQLSSFAQSEEVAAGVEILFTAWATASSTTGEPVITLKEFLERFIAIAGKVERSVDAKPCAAPCEGGLPGDASELEKELVALISKEGANSWDSKAATLQTKGFEVTASTLKSTWQNIAPKIKKTVDADQPMACGHSCSTCPTKDECQVHGALKDIEDM